MTERKPRLTLEQARREGRLEEFIAQAERDGFGEADKLAFEEVLEKAAKNQK